jgi:hypothetical protein
VGRFLKFIHSKEKLLVIIALSLRQDLRVLRINKIKEKENHLKELKKHP